MGSWPRWRHRGESNRVAVVVGSRFEAGGFRDVDASGAPLDYSAHLDRALTYAPIIENRRLVRESLALASGQVVLDVGSGNGEEVREIASVVGEVRPGGGD